MYKWHWLLLVGVVIVICALVVIQSTKEPKEPNGIEEFSTIDLPTARAQRQQLQWEGEQRYNDFARVQSSTAIIPKDSVDAALRQVVPVSSNSSSSLLSMLSSTLYGGADDGTGKVGDTLEQTGIVQQKIDFCESLNTNDCDIFKDPRYAECGVCLVDGIGSKGGHHRGGMYISAEDQYRANELAKTTGDRAVYNPTVGSCPAGNFTLTGESCIAKAHELDCMSAGAPSSGNQCGQCFGGNSSNLLYVGPKPLTYSAILHVSHPGSHSVNGNGIYIQNSNGSPRVSIQASTKGVTLDPQQIPLELSEGDSLQITIYGVPQVWCAWLSSVDNKRTISLDIGVKSISPSNGFAIVGDSNSAKVSSAMANIKSWGLYKEKVPSTVMWYMRRNEVVKPAIVSAWYGMYPPVQNSAGNGTDVTGKVQELAGRNGNIPVQNMMNGDAKADYSMNSLWIYRDDGSVIQSAEGTTVASTRINNNVNIAVTVPATLAGPYYDIDTPKCAAGPMVLTEIGSGIMGSNSCYTAKGEFNPSQYCMTQLFTAAGGLSEGKAFPDNAEKAAALVVKTNGKPDLNATASTLNNLGSIALYGVDNNGAPAEFAVQQKAALSMLGVTLSNPCDGPTKNTGPHTPQCLDYLWKTSGNPGQDSSNTDPGKIPYAYCALDGGSAPIQKGIINNANVLVANDLGGVNEVRSYYNSLFVRSQDSSDFDAQAAAMKSCYGVSLTAPPVNTTCPTPASPPLPLAVNGLKVWYDGADPNGDGKPPTNASPIQRWINKTGNSQYDAIASTPATYSAGTKSLNFNGKSLYATNYPGNPTTETMFIVFNIPNPNVNTCTLIGGSTGGRGVGLGYNGTGSKSANGMLNIWKVWQLATPNGSYRAGTTALTTCQVNGGTLTMSTDGGGVTSAQGSYDPGTLMWLGSQLEPTNTYNYVGYAMEILIFGTVLGTSDLQKVEGYLAWKWGTQEKLPNTHPYRSISPDGSQKSCEWITAANSDSWKNVNGAYVYAAIDSDNTVIGLNSANGVYRGTMTGSSWKELPGALTQIDIKGGNMVGIANYGAQSGKYGGSIWKWQGSTWEQLPGSALWVSVGADGDIWCVNKEGTIYRWNGAPNWVVMPGSAIQVSVGDANNVWVCNGYAIYTWSVSDWVYVPTPVQVKQVSVTAGGTRLVAVGTNGNIYASRDRGASWTQIPGNFDGYVTINDNYILAGNKSNATLYSRKLTC